MPVSYREENHPNVATFPRWLSQQEAADYLGVTDRTIRNYIRTGALTGRRLPGSRLIRIDRHEVDAALRAVPSARIDGGGHS